MRDTVDVTDEVHAKEGTETPNCPVGTGAARSSSPNPQHRGEHALLRADDRMDVEEDATKKNAYDAASPKFDGQGLGVPDVKGVMTR
mgnify:CR=1 FL=1